MIDLLPRQFEHAFSEGSERSASPPPPDDSPPPSSDGDEDREPVYLDDYQPVEGGHEEEYELSPRAGGEHSFDYGGGLPAALADDAMGASADLASDDDGGSWRAGPRPPSSVASSVDLFPAPARSASPSRGSAEGRSLSETLAPARRSTAQMERLARLRKSGKNGLKAPPKAAGGPVDPSQPPPQSDLVKYLFSPPKAPASRAPAAEVSAAAAAAGGGDVDDDVDDDDDDDYDDYHYDDDY